METSECNKIPFQLSECFFVYFAMARNVWSVCVLCMRTACLPHDAQLFQQIALHER